MGTATIYCILIYGPRNSTKPIPQDLLWMKTSVIPFRTPTGASWKKNLTGFIRSWGCLFKIP